MKNCYFWATPSGSINLIEGDKMPVRPKKFDYESGGDPPFTSPYLAPSYYDAMEVYEAALQRAKESSVPIQDQLRARKMCMLFGEIKPDTIYGPFTVEYEIDYRIEERPCNNCGKGNGCCYQCTKVAILLPDKERKDFNPLYKKISDDQWFKKSIRRQVDRRQYTREGRRPGIATCT